MCAESTRLLITSPPGFSPSTTGRAYHLAGIASRTTAADGALAFDLAGARGRSRTMRPVVHVLAALGLLLAAAAPSYAACGDNPGDAGAVAATRAQIAQQCPCSGFTSHGAYVRCAAGVTNQAVQAGTLSQECANAVMSCAGSSTCGTRGAVTCCQTDASGATTCSIKSRPGACKAPAGRHAPAGP